MRLVGLPFKLFKRHKSKNFATILAIALSMLMIIVVNVAINTYNYNVSRFFEPLKKYNVIVEKKSDFVQFIPINSYINQSEVIGYCQSLGVQASSAIFEFLEDENNPVMPNILTGLNPAIIPSFFDIATIDHGRWPAGDAREVVVGIGFRGWNDTIDIGENITINGQNLTLIGIHHFDNVIFDGMAIVPLTVAQNISGMDGICNMVLSTKGQVPNEAQLKSNIENQFPTLKFLQEGELDVISREFIQITGSWNVVFIVLVLIVSFAFTSSAFLLDYQAIKRQFAFLKIQGTPRSTIFGIVLGENIMILVLGILLGLLLAIFIYPALISSTTALQGLDINILTAYSNAMAHDFPWVMGAAGPNSAWIFGIGIFQNTAPYMLALKGELKDTRVFNE